MSGAATGLRGAVKVPLSTLLALALAPPASVSAL
jgi:hypothetical protein